MGGATVTPSLEDAATSIGNATATTDASSAKTTHASSNRTPRTATTAGLVPLALCEAAGAAVAAVIADTVLYAMDSAKIRAQSSPSSLSSSSSLQPTVAATTTTIGAASGQSSAYLKKNNSLQTLFRGLVPTILFGSVPVFATFFVLYAPLKQVLLVQYDNDSDEESSSSSSSSLSLLLPLLSGLCAIPATLMGVPADVLKKRLILLDTTHNNDGKIRTALTHIAASPPAQGSLLRGLFTGWQVNLMRDVPFAVVKLGLYECFVEQFYQRQFFVPVHRLLPPNNGGTTRYNNNNHDDNSFPGANNDNIYNSQITNHPDHQHQYQPPHKKHPISTTGAAICGVASGVCCAILTCPLDVVNTRIKAGVDLGGGGGGGRGDSSSIRRVAMDIVATQGPLALFRGVVLRSVILGVGSCIFWPLQTTIATWLLLESHDVLGVVLEPPKL
jgi:Mitochondrial carrier protein